MKLENLRKLLIHELKDLYSAENQIVNALPQMIDRSRSDDLRSALEEHLEKTRQQTDRLEKVFQDLGEKPSGQHCEGMEGLIREGERLLEEDADEDVRDAGIIAAAQRVEHYEIAAYGTAVTYAEMMEESAVAERLKETLDEEKSADHILTEIAKEKVNPRAHAAT